MSAHAHELTLTRTFDAPRDVVFRCFTDPKLLMQWFAPKPWTITSTDMDVRPGGVFNFVMRSPEGEDYPNEGIFLEVVPNEKIVTTDGLAPGFKPAGKPFMVAEMTFEDLGGGKTRYTATARHWSAEDKTAHEQMGFNEGWGQTADQLGALAKTL